MSIFQPRLEMISALEHYSKQGNCLKLTTGSGELDSLIDGIQEGLFYLFYGDLLPLDALSHRLLVNCILSVKEHGFESMAACFNNTDYYGRGKMILNPEKIAKGLPNRLVIKKGPSKLHHDRFILTRGEGWSVGHSLKDFGKKTSVLIKLASSLETETAFDENWIQSETVFEKNEVK